MLAGKATLRRVRSTRLQSTLPVIRVTASKAIAGYSNLGACCSVSGAYSARTIKGNQI